MASRGWEKVTRTDLARMGRRGQTDTPSKPGLEGATMPQGRSKYRNVRTMVGGERFDSAREAAYWQGLLARQAAGEVKDLKRQVEFPLYCPASNGQATQVSAYKADFTFLEMGVSGFPDGLGRVVDAKGHRTALYRLKKKWLELQDGIEIIEV